MSFQQCLDVRLARPADRLSIVGRDHGCGDVGIMQPGMVRLARCEPIDVIPRFCEERAGLLDRRLAQHLVVLDVLALGGADGRNRHLLVPVRESEQRDGVVAAMSRLGHDRHARPERMANADDRHRLKRAAAEFLGPLCQHRAHLRHK